MDISSEIPKEELSDLADLCKKAPYGALVEVGVYRGGSAQVIYNESKGRPVHLFDTFNGMPRSDDGDSFEKGWFSDTDVEFLKKAFPNATFHIGIFPETLPDDLQNIAFVHLDADNFQVTYDGISFLWPRMISKAILAFDDFAFESIRKAISKNLSILPKKIRRTRHGVHYFIKE